MELHFELLRYPCLFIAPAEHLAHEDKKKFYEGFKYMANYLDFSRKIIVRKLLVTI